MKNNKKIILIVEDESSYQHILTDKLVQKGFDIVVASNGEDGLNIAFSNHPDLIILDLEMPKMDGIEMAKKLRQDKWGKDAKVLVLTNFSEVNKLQQVLESEIFHYIVKSDIKIDDLIQNIEQIVG